MFARLFRIEQVKASRKVKQELFTNKKTRKRRDQLSVFIYLKMPKLEKIFKTAVIATKTLTVLKIFTRLFCFEQAKASEKN